MVRKEDTNVFDILDKLDDSKPKCQHRNIPGFCPDCGNAIYPVGSELYYKRFQDIWTVGGALIIEDAMKILEESDDDNFRDALKTFVTKYQKEYRRIKEVYQDLPNAMKELHRGKKPYK